MQNPLIKIEILFFYLKFMTKRRGRPLIFKVDSHLHKFKYVHVLKCLETNKTILIV